VIFYTARRVSGPITRLQKVASDFEKGSYDEGKEVLERIEKRRDELGRFAQSFSTMAREIRLREKRLSEWNANLEETVRLRTLELEKANKAMASELAEAATYARAVLPARRRGPSAQTGFSSPPRSWGDSFGYHWIDDDTLSLYLLDVCGHGVGAALLSISVVNVLRTGSLAGTDFRNPSAVLANMNAAFPMEQHNEMYFTGWYGVYSRTSRILKLCLRRASPGGPDRSRRERASSLGARGRYRGVPQGGVRDPIRGGVSRLSPLSLQRRNLRDRPPRRRHDDARGILRDPGRPETSCRTRADRRGNPPTAGHRSVCG